MKNFTLVISSIIFLQLLTISYCKAQKIELIKDICTSTSNSNPHNITIVGNTTYFFATGDAGYGLWKKNNSSVEFIKKLPYKSEESINHEGILFFTTSNEKDYFKSTIWSSDGTEEGTKIINKNTLEYVQGLTSFNKRLCYVQRKNNVKSLVFYDKQKSDTIKNLKIFLKHKNIKVYNNSIYYFEGEKLFKVDNSFKIIKEFKIYDGFEPSYLLDTLGNKLYLIGENKNNSYKSELVSIDTQDKSEKIQVITNDYTPYIPKYNSIRYGNEIYFSIIKSAGFTDGGFELWKTDGTSNNTKTIKTISYPDYNPYPLYSVVFNDKLYFIAKTSREISNIWQYEKKNNTIKLLNSNQFNNPTTLATDGKTLYFSAYDTSYGQELWESDGVTKHQVIKDLNTSNCSSNIGNITKFKEKLYFSAFTPTHGQEFWSSDGTKEGTSMLKDINSGKVSSYPSRMAILDDNLYFNARTEQHGIELWKSDGTEKGTKLFKDFITGPKSSSPSSLAKYKNRLFFFAKIHNPNSKTKGFWSTDGTIEGTKIVKSDIRSPFSYSSSYITFKNNLFFTAYGTPNRGAEIWITDGTPSNTKEFKDIFKKRRFSGSYPNYYTSLNDKFYFQARDTLGRELWVSDGTNEGTKLLKDIIEGKEGSSPRYLTTYNNKIIFSAEGENKGRELWITDGTKEGTKLLKDIYSGKKSSAPYGFTIFENKLFFRATTEEHGRELWSTDGTEDGTKLYMDINKGKKSSSPYALTPFKGKLYLSANNGENGNELMVITPKESDNATTLSVLDDTKTTPIILYPNPAQSFFILKSAVEGRVNILDLSGKALIKGKVNSEINIDHLPLGLYPVEVILINGKTYKTKLLKKD